MIHQAMLCRSFANRKAIRLAAFEKFAYLHEEKLPFNVRTLIAFVAAASCENFQIYSLDPRPFNSHHAEKIPLNFRKDENSIFICLTA